MKAKPKISYVVKCKYHMYDWNDPAVSVVLREYLNRNLAIAEARHLAKVHIAHDFRAIRCTEETILDLPCET